MLLEEIVKQGLSNLITQGVGWTLFVLSWVLFYFVFRFMGAQLDKQRTRSDALTDQYTKDLAAIQAARLNDMREILEALNRSSNESDELKRSVENRSQAILDLTAGFAKFVADANARSERWTDFRRTLEDILGRLNTFLVRQGGQQ